MRLFSESVTETDDESYKFVATNQTSEPERTRLEALWQRYEPYADAKFASQFRKNFYSRLWELWLGNIFLDQNFVLAARRATEWPDFIVSDSSGQYFVEAICPDNASEESGNRIQELNMVEFQEVKSELYELRIQRAISEKNKKKYREVTNQKQVPYLLAINICKLPFSTLTFGDFPWIAKALYPIGNEVTLVSRDMKDFKILRERKEANRTKSGRPVSKTIFSSSDYSHISAIVYSNIPIGLEEGRLREKICIVRNPHAENPLGHTFGLEELVIDYSEKGVGCHLVAAES